MAGRIVHRLILPLLLSAVVVLLTSACERPPYVMTLEVLNSTGEWMQLRVDGRPLPSDAPWVEPGGTRGVVMGRSEWVQPRRVQAYDVHGELRFERALTDADLDALNWRVVLQGDQRPPSP